MLRIPKCMMFKRILLLLIGLYALLLTFLLIRSPVVIDTEPRHKNDETFCLAKLSLSENLRVSELKEHNFAVQILEERLSDSLQQIDQLKKEAQDVKKNGNLPAASAGVQYKPEYEVSRRRLRRSIRELQHYLSSELRHIIGDKPDDNQLTAMKGRLEGHFALILALHHNMSATDGYEEARLNESKLVQETIESRLNQADQKCGPVMGTDVMKRCGFACQFHHVLYSQAVAYFANRKLLLTSESWSYSNEGFHGVFSSLNDSSCPSSRFSFKTWQGDFDAPALSFPIIDALRKDFKYLPMSVPAQLKTNTNMLSLHGNPFSLLAGHLARRLMRLRPHVSEQIDHRLKQCGFEQGPIVGVHVRRTDKINTEASLHKIEEYMVHVDRYFSILDYIQGQHVKRRVFIATDDPSVFQEARAAFPQYEITGSERSAEMGAVNVRYTPDSVVNLIGDIILLSRCDYIVCTFSSQVSRLAYELMQTRHVDASWRFNSLDDIYYFGGQRPHEYLAMHDYNATKSNEIDVKTGDLIGIAGNHWNGYCVGENRRTKKYGFFASHIAEDSVRIEQEL